MEPKKHKRVQLENKRTLFFQAGLIITLALILGAFEWASSPPQQSDYSLSNVVALDQEIAVITRETEVKPPPKAPQPKELINIISNLDNPTDEYLPENLEHEYNDLIDFGEFIETPEKLDPTPFVIVQDMPTFGGEGIEGFRVWVMRNLRYPEIAAEMGVSGTVILQFVIGFGGDVEDITVARAVDPALDKEAVRVVSASPKWTPGLQRGKPARVIFTLPVSFVLQ